MQSSLIYYEDITINESWQSSARTVTESDIVAFAGVSGDFNPLHVDATLAKQSLFGQRIAHGLLGLSIASGLRSPEQSFAIMAFMSLDWKFTQPIFIGDTIHCISHVKQKKDLGGPGGIVKIMRSLRNQDEAVVQEGQFTLMVSKKVA